MVGVAILMSEIAKMKNSLGDLNDHLFAQMERLGDEDLSGDDLGRELERTKALTSVSREIVSNAQTMLKAKALALEYGGVDLSLPQLTGPGNGKD